MKLVPWQKQLFLSSLALCLIISILCTYKYQHASSPINRWRIDTFLPEFEEKTMRCAFDTKQFSFDMRIHEGRLWYLKVNGKKIPPIDYKLYPEIRHFIHRYQSQNIDRAKQKSRNLNTRTFLQ